MTRTSAIVAAIFILFLSAASGATPVPGAHPGGYTSPDMPEIWRDTDEVTLRRAEEVALMDAWSKTAEFVLGMATAADTRVRDLVDAEQRLEGILRTTLSRLSAQKLFHYDNGLVQCRVTVDMNALRRFLAGAADRDDAGLSDEEWLAGAFALEEDRKPTPVQFWGNGALAGSQGVPVIHAVRAAELDAAAQILAKMEGEELERRTRVRNFTLASDVIRAILDAARIGIQYTEYRVDSGIVEVEAELREKGVVHRALGKAALAQPLETRQPNARKAIEEARHARRQRGKK